MDDNFTTLRADWKAQGCPADHAYLRLELPAPTVEPLLGGIPSVPSAMAQAFRAQSDANIRAMLR